MKHVSINVLQPGMKISEDIFSQNKQLILPNGYTLTSKAIEMLKAYNIISLHIEDPVGIEVEELPELDENGEAAPLAPEFLGSSAENLLVALEAYALTLGTEPEESIVGEPTKDSTSPTPSISVNTQEEPSHFEKLKQSPEFKQFKGAFENNVTEIRQGINDIVEKNAPIQIDTLLSSTMELINTQTNSFGVFDMLHNMRQFDDLTYAHSVNVSLICNVFSQWLGFSEEEQRIATASGMLHDIGKLKIDDAIIKKPGRLTEEEFRKVQYHAIEGYKILQPQNISEHIKNAALMHHEKCDGTGYPLKLTGERIDRFAKLVAIADVYDAMTSARVYRGSMCPFSVIRIFEDEGLNKYDTEYIMKFLENVINTYIDNRVQLSNGKIGTVRWIDKQHLARPMLQLADGSFLELAKHPELNIIKIL